MGHMGREQAVYKPAVSQATENSRLSMAHRVCGQAQARGTGSRVSGGAKLLVHVPFISAKHKE